MAKSAKMVPVMIGTILLGEAKYTLREYIQVFAIVAGTAMVALSKKKDGGDSTTFGAAFIVAALVLDGVTGGMQNKIRAKGEIEGNSKVRPWCEWKRDGHRHGVDRDRER